MQGVGTGKGKAEEGEEECSTGRGLVLWKLGLGMLGELHRW